MILKSKKIDILYEDNHLIAVNKPSDILVQGDSSRELSLMDVLKEYIKNKYQKPGNVFLGLIHRLDKPASGVVLFARTSKGASRLCAQWRSHTITKIYWAQVHGHLTPERGTITSYLARDFNCPDQQGRSSVRKPGVSDKKEKGKETSQESILSYITLPREWLKDPLSRAGGGEKTSMLEINLITGRKHQIRKQLAAAGCPIVGDLQYGAPYALADKTIHLVAKSLRFKHPTKDEIITIEAPLPEWVCKK